MGNCGIIVFLNWVGFVFVVIINLLEVVRIDKIVDKEILNLSCWLLKFYEYKKWVIIVKY